MTAVDGGRVDVFEANRSRLFGLAYRMLGEANEAEDVVQDAYLRWAQSKDVEVPEAWLTKVVTNLCLNRLTSARARRETYIGLWLPERSSRRTGGSARWTPSSSAIRSRSVFSSCWSG